jgi:hypothetical protein
MNYNYSKINLWLFSILIILITFKQSYGQEDSLVSVPDGKGWWKIPKTKGVFKIGGYVKLDFNYDLNLIDQPDFFDVSKVRTDGTKGTKATINIKETRLFTDFRYPTKKGIIRAYVEGDFYGTGGAFRIRLGYIDIFDKLRAGQYWTTFMDEDIIPATLDFEKPLAYLFQRNPMIRYKFNMTKGLYGAIAVETPNNKIQNPLGPGELLSPAPDLTARIRYFGDWGHIQASGFGAMLTYRDDSLVVKDNVGLWGVALSGKVNLFKRDHIIYQGFYGAGIGRYRGGLSAAVGDNNKLESIHDYGFTIGYKRQWINKLHSIIVYNQGQNENTSNQPGDAIRYLNYFAVNLIYEFISNGIVGVEYLRGLVKNKDSSSGVGNRIQLSIKYAFN